MDMSDQPATHRPRLFVHLIYWGIILLWGASTSYVVWRLISKN